MTTRKVKSFHEKIQKVKFFAKKHEEFSKFREGIACSIHLDNDNAEDKEFLFRLNKIQMYLEKRMMEMKKNYKKRIETIRQIQSNLDLKITTLANEAMEEKGVEIPARNMDYKIIPGHFDGAQLFTVSTEWDCPDSPFGWCMYHNVFDPSKDGCVFCNQPEERK